MKMRHRRICTRIGRFWHRHSGLCRQAFSADFWSWSRFRGGKGHGAYNERAEYYGSPEADRILILTLRRPVLSPGRALLSTMSGGPKWRASKSILCGWRNSFCAEYWGRRKAGRAGVFKKIRRPVSKIPSIYKRGKVAWECRRFLLQMMKRLPGIKW